MSAVEQTADLKTTPLHNLHLKLKARMVPFAGYSMPVQYELGTIKEHLHTRAAAGLFDVSHMGQLRLTARSGNAADAARALERVVPADIVGLPVNRQRYAVLLTEKGGMIDDMMVVNLGDCLMLVVNASRKDADEAYLRAELHNTFVIEKRERVLLALQGPKAESVLASLAPDCREMRFMDVRKLELLGARCVVMRAGYTGEDGFEISIPNENAAEVTETLLAHPDVKPIGLGARDTLRLEAGLPLYGQDINSETTPVEAQLLWGVPKVRRRGGARSGGFPGAKIILDQIETGPSRLRVGLKPEGRAPVRSGARVFTDETSTEAIGIVTSGSFGPSLNAPIAMGYVPASQSATGTRYFADVRGERVPLHVADLPFVPHNHKR